MSVLVLGIVAGAIGWFITRILMDEKSPLGWYYDLLIQLEDKFRDKFRFHWIILKPFGLCDKCFTGQLAFWSYFTMIGEGGYGWFQHLGFISVSVLTLQLIKKWS